MDDILKGWEAIAAALGLPVEGAQALLPEGLPARENLAGEPCVKARALAKWVRLPLHGSQVRRVRTQYAQAGCGGAGGPRL